MSDQNQLQQKVTDLWNWIAMNMVVHGNVQSIRLAQKFQPAFQEKMASIIQSSDAASLGQCGDANTNGNVYLTYKGGCRKPLHIQDAYRCTGCGGWFHKDCILKHFQEEKDHDWGRKEERIRIMGIYHAAVEDLYGKEIADMVTKRAGSIYARFNQVKKEKK